MHGASSGSYNSFKPVCINRFPPTYFSCNECLLIQSRELKKRVFQSAARQNLRQIKFFLTFTVEGFDVSKNILEVSQSIPKKVFYIKDTEQAIGRNRLTLRRWWEQGIFPKPCLINSRLAWQADVIMQWINQNIQGV